MSNSKRVLKDLIGEAGIEKLEKAIFKRGTQAIIDPMEFYLPLMVVPRAILSWLVQNIKPMKAGEHKDLPFPGKPEITIHIEKQDVDQYRAEFIQGGRIIHSFEKQSLPAVSAHFMTAGEIYDQFAEEEIAKEPLKNDTKEEHKTEVARAIINLSEVPRDAESQDSEHIKWTMSHANVKELTGVIGKLVDALVARESASKSVNEDLDKVAQKEVEGEDQKIKESTDPEDKAKDDSKKTKSNPDIKEEGMDFKELDELKSKPSIEQEKPKSEKVKAGTEAAEATTEKEKPFAKEEMPSKTGKVLKFRDIARRTKTELNPSKVPLKGQALAKPCKTINKQDTSPISPNTGVFKGELPSGAGVPKKPAMPKPALGAQGPSNSPAAAAAKQAQASARGKMAIPRTPGAPKIKNPTVASKAPSTPKAPTLKSENYFRSKLNNSKVQKNEWYNVSEEELYKSICKECGKANFAKKTDGMPSFEPCVCFAVMKKDEEGSNINGVEIIRKSDGTFNLKFDKSADPESVKAFLLMLKSRLLLKKHFGL